MTTRFNSIGVYGRKGENQKVSDPAIKGLIIPIEFSDASETLTGVSLPSRYSVISTVVNITEASTGGTQTLDVGISGNPDQFIDGAPTDTAEWVGPQGGEGPFLGNVSTEISYQFGALTGGCKAEIIITYIGE